MKALFIIILIHITTFSVFSQARKNTSKIKAPSGVFSIRKLEQERKKMLKDIELTSKLLKETKASTKSSLNRLNLLSQQLLSRKKIIKLLGQEISTLDVTIDSLNKDIQILSKGLDKAKKNYVKSMQHQQQEFRNTQYKMLLILSAENLSQSYRRMRYLQEYSDWQKKEAGRIQKKQDEVTRRKSVLEQSRKEKQQLLDQRAKEEMKLKNEEKSQQKEIDELNRKQKDLNQLLQQKRKEANALNDQIARLIEEDIRKSSEKSKAKTAPSESKASSGKNYVMTAAELNLSKNFSGNKGKLPPPITEEYTVVSRFGKHQHQKLSHVKTNNNGIDIQTTAGAEARSVFKGVVTRVFIMPGFNNNVIVRHGNFLTVYSNLSQVYVQAGDAVNTMQSIGKVFTDTQKGNETILHFQIWKERTKLNPESWLR